MTLSIIKTISRNYFVGALLIVLTFSLLTCVKGPQETIEEVTAACFDVDATTKSLDSEFIFSDCSLYADSYHWDFGNGDTSSAKDPRYAYTSTGNFEVILTTLIAGEPDNTQSKNLQVRLSDRYIDKVVGISGMKIFSTEDNEFLAVGNHYLDQNSVEIRPYVLRLFPDLREKWYLNYDPGHLEIAAKGKNNILLVENKFGSDPKISLETISFTGEALNTMEIGLPDNKSPILNKIIPASDGGYFIGGRIRTGPTAFVMRVTSNITHDWTDLYAIDGPSSVVSLIQLQDEGLILLATKNLDDDDNYEARLIRTDDQGQVQWTNTFCENCIKTSKEFRNFGLANEEIYIVIANQLQKYDLQGNLTFSEQLNPETIDLRPLVIRTEENGEFVLVDGDEGRLNLKKYDANGNQIWSTGKFTHYISHQELSIDKTPEGVYIIMREATSHGLRLFLVDKNGKIL